MADATSPIDIEKLVNNWSQRDPDKLLVSIYRWVEPNLTEAEKDPGIRAGATASFAIDALQDIEGFKQIGDVPSAIRAAVILGMCCSELLSAPLRAELTRRCQEAKARSKGRLKGAYKHYGSQEQYFAAHEEWAAIRDRILEETPDIKRDNLLRKIANESAFRSTDGNRSFGVKAIRAGLKEFDGRRAT